MTVGESIKNQLRARKMSISDLASKTGLSNDDIKNILYDRSKNVKKLQLIAEALNVPLSILFPTTLQSPFSHPIYELAVRVVSSNFTSLSISADKEVFDEYVAQMYNYIANNKSRSENEIFVYCEGMLRNAINTGALLKNS